MISAVLVPTLTVRAEAAKDGQGMFRLPKRLARARRVAESKRLDTFREVHEALKKTAREEQAFIKDFFNNTRDMLRDDTEEARADEEEAEAAEE